MRLDQIEMPEIGLEQESQRLRKGMTEKKTKRSRRHNTENCSNESREQRVALREDPQKSEGNEGCTSQSDIVPAPSKNRRKKVRERAEINRVKDGVRQELGRIRTKKGLTCRHKRT